MNLIWTRVKAPTLRLIPATSIDEHEIQVNRGHLLKSKCRVETKPGWQAFSYAFALNSCNC